jgi:hypothetical protein
MRRTLTLLVAAAAFVVASACSSSNNPSSPSPTAGIVVNGSIVVPGTGGSTSGLSGPSVNGSVPAGLTITVVGTSITVTVNANGTFTINGVPAGNVDLRLNGPGLSALVSLLELQTGQTITVTITLDGTTASLDSDRRQGPSGEELEGRVESLPPTTAAGTFVVAGRTVTTNGSTTFTMQGQPAAFADLAIGQRVHVKGTPGTTSLLATSVNIQNTNTDIGTNLNGTVAAFTGSSTAFQFTVDGRLVKGDAATVFYGNSAFTDLANGARVEVKGSLRDGYVYATRIHVN